MNCKAPMLVALLISFEACAQINSKFKYSTDNQGDDTGSIHFPENVQSHESDEELIEARKTQGSDIPLDVVAKINSLSNITEFFQEFVAKDSLNSEELLASRFGDEKIERSVGIEPKHAECIPQPTLVPLEPLHMSKDSRVLYYPSCTRVDRCGGCCNSPLLSCQPVEKETLTYLVFKSRYVGNGKMKPLGKEAILVDKHIKCQCDCRIKETDCNAYQRYDESQCKCICTNRDEQEKCFRQADKIWDWSSCRCTCRDTNECTTGTFFDDRLCRCVQVFYDKTGTIGSIQNFSISKLGLG